MTQVSILNTRTFDWSNSGSFSLCVAMPYGAHGYSNRFKSIHIKDVI